MTVTTPIHCPHDKLWKSSMGDVRVAREFFEHHLPPAILVDATPENVAKETSRVMVEMLGRPGHIFNLGHGLPPAAKLENIEALVNTVRKFNEHA